nr:ribonuclease H-like domain-containing protein [Tanacetum cinerariifolium]
AEAEYRVVANTVAETCWLRSLLRELHTPLSTATLVYCDNVSAVYLSSNPVQHQRTKHIEIDIHFVRDLGSTSRIRVLHVSSHYQYADIFTKGLPTALFDEFRSSLSKMFDEIFKRKKSVKGTLQQQFAMAATRHTFDVVTLQKDWIAAIHSSSAILHRRSVSQPYKEVYNNILQGH